MCVCHTHLMDAVQRLNGGWSRSYNKLLGLRYSPTWYRKYQEKSYHRDNWLVAAKRSCYGALKSITKRVILVTVNML